MNKHDIHRNDRSGMAAIFGLLLAILVGAIAMMPLEWFIAVLILAVLAMPAVLIVESALQHVRETSDLPLS